MTNSDLDEFERDCKTYGYKSSSIFRIEHERIKVTKAKLEQELEKAKSMTSIQEMLASTGLGPDEILEHFATQKEKAKKYDDELKQFLKTEDHNEELLEENKSLKERIETDFNTIKKQQEKIERISDKLGNELQVKYLEIEQLQEELKKCDGSCAPYKLRPTYQVIEQKLEKIQSWFNNHGCRLPIEREKELKAILKENN